MSPTDLECQADPALILMELSSSHHVFNANAINKWRDTCSNLSLINASALLSLIKTITSTARIQSDFHKGSIKYAIKIQSLGNLHYFFSSFTNGPLRQIFNNLDDWPIDILEERCKSLIVNQRNDEHNFTSSYQEKTERFIRSLNTKLLPVEKIDDQLKSNLLSAADCLHIGTNPALDTINHKKRPRNENTKNNPTINLKVTNRFSQSFTKVFACFSIPTNFDNPSEFAVLLVNQFGKSKNYPTHRLPIAGIIDGYSGNHCARYMTDHLADRISCFITDNAENTSLKDSSVYHFLQQLYPEINDSYLKTIPHDKLAMQKSGCVVSFAFILNHSCWISNCGDCFVIRSKDNKPIMYSRPPYIDQNKEKSKYFGDDAIERGCEIAYVWENNKWSPSLRASSFAPHPSTKIWQGLTTTHSLGRTLESGIAPTAEIYKIDLHDLGNEDLLILASNGIMSVMSPAQASFIVSTYRSLGYNLEDTCKYLCNIARNLGSQDDVTVLILDLKEAYQQSIPLPLEEFEQDPLL